MTKASNNLARQKCVPCEGGVKRIAASAAKELATALPGWKLAVRAKRLERSYTFKNFRENMAFLNRVAEIAEAQGHNPDFSVHYNRCDFAIFTHAIDGLSKNDFILAAKIDRIAAIQASGKQART